MGRLDYDNHLNRIEEAENRNEFTSEEVVSNNSKKTYSETFEGQNLEEANRKADKFVSTQNDIINISKSSFDVEFRSVVGIDQSGVNDVLEFAIRCAVSQVPKNALEITSPEVIQKSEIKTILIYACNEESAKSKALLKKPLESSWNSFKCKLKPTTFIGIPIKKGIWESGYLLRNKVQVKYKLPARVVVYYEKPEINENAC